MKKHGHKEAGPSQRQLRVGEELRHVISETLRQGHFHDEVLFEQARNVTVSEVRASPDLKNATAYVMSLGGQNMEEILPALNEASPYFQQEINRKMNMKFTPRVHFKRDESFAEAQKIEGIIQNLPHHQDE